MDPHFHSNFLESLRLSHDPGSYQMRWYERLFVMSKPRVFRQYSRILGLSGTIGNEREQAFLQKAQTVAGLAAQPFPRKEHRLLALTTCSRHSDGLGENLARCSILYRLMFKDVLGFAGLEDVRNFRRSKRQASDMLPNMRVIGWIMARFSSSFVGLIVVPFVGQRNSLV